MLATMDSPQYYSPSGDNSNFDYFNIVENNETTRSSSSYHNRLIDDDDQKPNVDLGLASSCVYGPTDQQLSLLQPSTSSASYYPATINSSILLPTKQQQLQQQQQQQSQLQLAPPPATYQGGFINSYASQAPTNPYAAYSFAPPWFRQDFSVKAEQMANLLNR